MTGMISLTAAALALGSSLATSEDELRQLGAHVHGAAQLAVAADPDSGEVLAELTSAAWNIYGFERAPANADERAMIAAANDALTRGLLVFPRALCSLSGVEISGSGPAGRAQDDHRDHDHDHHHGHDHHGEPPPAGGHEGEMHAGHGQNGEPDERRGHHDEHEHGPHEDHGHAHDDHGRSAHEHAHSDLLVSWTYHCERPRGLEQVDLNPLFSAFPRLESVDTQFFDGSRAAARALTPAAPTLRLY